MTDLLVGLLACGIGVVALLAAIVNWDSSFQLDKARWIERRWGRSGARVVYACLGLLMIGLGALIALGAAPYTWWQG